MTDDDGLGVEVRLHLRSASLRPGV
jgi:hypothetical protein